MATFIKRPNLPKSIVTLCAVSCDKPEIVKALNNLGIKTITTIPDETLASAVSSHADMLIHHLGGNDVMVLNKLAEYAKSLQDYGFYVIDVQDKPKALYPDDIRLNLLVLGDIAFGKLDSVDSGLLSHYQRQGIKLVDVKQGYAKCSVFIVGERAIITADKSIANACDDNGVDVLLIKEGGIGINTYDYGFIGGCGGLISKDVAVLTGDVNLHPDGERIIKFANKNGVRLISLTPYSLYDIGGILPLMQE